MNKSTCMIYFKNEQTKLPITYRQKMLVRGAVLATLDHEQFQNDVEVSVTFTDNAGIQKLNAEFRHIDKPTDVLSFPLIDFEGEKGEPAADEEELALGDIVISLERAQAQAEEFGHSLDREVAFLTAHSMLHLLGYDHEKSAEDDADMRARQREIMEMMHLSVKSTNETEEKA